MMHVLLWSSTHTPRMHERTRFILRHGVVPWGMVVGGIVTALSFATGLPMGHGPRPPALVVALLAILCFGEWSVLGGWLIGAVLWTLGPGAHATQKRMGGRRPTSGDRGR